MYIILNFLWYQSNIFSNLSHFRHHNKHNPLTIITNVSQTPWQKQVWRQTSIPWSYQTRMRYITHTILELFLLPSCLMETIMGNGVVPCAWVSAQRTRWCSLMEPLQFCHPKWKLCILEKMQWYGNTVDREFCPPKHFQHHHIHRICCCNLERSQRKVFIKQRLKNLSDSTRNYWKSSRTTLDFLLLYQDESLIGWVSILPWSTCLHLCRFKGTHWTRRERKSFLMGLNESYSTIRGWILMMNPLPDTRQVCGLILQHEWQMDVASRWDMGMNFHAMQVRQNLTF